MSWTDERVERLSTLWLEGRSASQIAAELGGGVTRNAVIGKVHRLGLSGRTLPPAVEAASRVPDAVEAEPRVEAPVAEAVAVADAAPAPEAVLAVEVEAACAAPVEVHEIRAAVPAAPVAEPSQVDRPAVRAHGVGLPLSDRVTILELGASMCRWPIGDPTSAEFRFCGCRATGTLPYCQEHARLAFQPVADRRRPERLIRIA